MFLQSAVRTVTTAALFFAAPAIQAQPLPSAADVIAKHVAAIGGRDAIMQITPMK